MKEENLMSIQFDAKQGLFYLTNGRVSYLIRLAGGINVAAEIADAYWAEIDYEQLLVWGPEYIILASGAKYTPEDVRNDPNLAACSAVVNGNVYQIPADAESWDSPVPGSILGALWLANILHPGLLSNEACKELMNEYYETFYDFTYCKN
jgi:iron complex transport system substrate-binding protein